MTTGFISHRTLWALFCGVLILGSQSCSAPRLKEPGGTAEDARMAFTNPDEYAWRLFFFLNHPAKEGIAGKPDETKKFGQLDEQAAVVWETWALASGKDKSEVFRPDGAHPVSWDGLDRTKNLFILDENIERQVFEMDLQESQILDKTLKRQKNQLRRRRSRSKALMIFPPNASDDRQEVRMNRSTFDFISSHEMYNADGLEHLLAQARRTGNRSLITLPSCSKEVKAEWWPIDESQKTRYLWRQDENKQLWGLVSLHIITKDLPNWFWADFGHIDCESAPSAKTEGEKDMLATCGNQPAETKPVDRTTRGPNGTAGPSGLNGIRKETEGTIWANYILRGTETNFTSATGRANILSNPVLERFNQQSSCITCHALAAIGLPSGNNLPKDNRLRTLNQQPGTPDPVQFGDVPGCEAPSCIKYLQTDFMWAPIMLAQRQK